MFEGQYQQASYVVQNLWIKSLVIPLATYRSREAEETAGRSLVA